MRPIVLRLEERLAINITLPFEVLLEFGFGNAMIAKHCRARLGSSYAAKSLTFKRSLEITSISPDMES
jgi:hypothetical protein